MVLSIIKYQRRIRKMLNWCMAHPWMTFFIVLSVIESITAIIKYTTGWHRTDKEIELAILKENKES